MAWKSKKGIYIKLLHKHCEFSYVAGFCKTNHVHTKMEIHLIILIVQFNSHTQALSTHDYKTATDNHAGLLLLMAF